MAAQISVGVVRADEELRLLLLVHRLDCDFQSFQDRAGVETKSCRPTSEPGRVEGVVLELEEEAVVDGHQGPSRNRPGRHKARDKHLQDNNVVGKAMEREMPRWEQA